MEAMGEREVQLADVLQTEGWSQRVKHLSRRTEELQQTAKTRLQSLQDAAKVHDTFKKALQELCSTPLPQSSRDHIISIAAKKTVAITIL